MYILVETLLLVVCCLSMVLVWMQSTCMHMSRCYWHPNWLWFCCHKQTWKFFSDHFFYQPFVHFIDIVNSLFQQSYVTSSELGKCQNLCPEEGCTKMAESLADCNDKCNNDDSPLSL